MFQLVCIVIVSLLEWFVSRQKELLCCNEFLLKLLQKLVILKIAPFLPPLTCSLEWCKGILQS